MEMIYSEPIRYRCEKKEKGPMSASYTDGTFIKYLRQHEFTKKILYRCWIKHKLLSNALRSVLYMFTNAPLTDTSKRTYLHVMSCNGDRSSLDLTYVQHHNSTFLNIQNSLVNSMGCNRVISSLPVTYIYTPIAHERTSVSILYLNENKYEVFINPIGYFTFPDSIRVKSNRDLMYFPNLQLGNQDILVFVIQIENRVQESRRQYFTAEERSQRIAQQIYKEEEQNNHHKFCNLLCKIKSSLQTEDVVEEVVEVEESVEAVENVEVTLDITFKCKINPRITKLLYQSYHNRGEIYKLILNKKILVMTDIHHNFIPEQFKHFGIRLSDETTTSFTYHFYVDELQILYYTSVLRVYD